MRNLIEKTKTFLNLEPIKQNVYSRREKMNEIKHQYHLASYLGFKKWKEVHKPDSYTENVVKELFAIDRAAKQALPE
ncbi:hypothetical protein FUA48_09785 [Flavobacterium alkalisoli]|uniref:Uncharacterized protein n=1 Tax=Flavobacterium alkalisoli TaxID=2602769 RepID=A0A5B9FSH3_9FLAO|nr:hypothetical protein [Flavobacterium alkalisoli]QEE49865.1 hypothetical protein FUA48_09785 [Flavobacterium alkalisoli]